MTMKQPGLTPDLIFEPDGHVSDLCVTCVADGELALVLQPALDHLDACDACCARLGDAALLSVAAGEALAQLPAVAVAQVASPAAIAPETLAPVSPQRARRPMPIAAIAAALVIATLSAWPTLSELPSLAAAAVGWIPTLLRVARSVLLSGPSVLGPWALALKGASALLFLLAGLQVARISERRRAMAIEGGER